VLIDTKGWTPPPWYILVPRLNVYVQVYKGTGKTIQVNKYLSPSCVGTSGLSYPWTVDPTGTVVNLFGTRAIGCRYPFCVLIGS